MAHRIIRLDEPVAWDAALEAVGGADVYYRRGYVTSLKNRGEGEPILIASATGSPGGCHVALIRELPAALRDAGVAGIDLISPYGYAGPLLSPDAAKADFERAWTGAAQELGAVSEFVRFHPVLKTDASFIDAAGATTIAQTVAIDLGAGEVANGLSATCRKNLNVAIKKKVAVEIRDGSAIGRFARLYRLTMERLGAADYYLFDEGYFADLAAGLGDDVIVGLATHEGQDVAGALILRTGSYLHYHLGGSDFTKRSLCATNLLLVRVAEHGRELGCRTFHLGGGVKAGDSLFEFKAGFSPVRCDFAVGRRIFRHDEYRRLTEAHRRNGPIDEHFFPAYRAPALHPPAVQPRPSR